MVKNEQKMTKNDKKKHEEMLKKPVKMSKN